MRGGKSPVWPRVRDCNKTISCMTWLHVLHSPLCNQHCCPHLISCEEQHPHDKEKHTWACTHQARTCTNTHTHISPFWMTSEDIALWWWTLQRSDLCWRSDIYMRNASTAASTPHRKWLPAAWVYLSDQTWDIILTFISALMKAALVTDWSVVWCFMLLSRVCCGRLKV